MIPTRVIEKAIEAGWSARTHSCADDTDLATYPEISFDPAFWQSLGKALNWPSDDPTEPSPVLLDEWKRTCPRGRANQFFNLHYVGGDLAAYWDELMP